MITRVFFTDPVRELEDPSIDSSRHQSNQPLISLSHWNRDIMHSNPKHSHKKWLVQKLGLVKKKQKHKVNIPEGYNLFGYSHSKVLRLLPNQTSRKNTQWRNSDITYKHPYDTTFLFSRAILTDIVPNTVFLHLSIALLNFISVLDLTALCMTRDKTRDICSEELFLIDMLIKNDFWPPKIIYFS